MINLNEFCRLKSRVQNPTVDAIKSTFEESVSQEILQEMPGVNTMWVVRWALEPSLFGDPNA